MTPGRFHGQGQLCSPTPVTLALDAPAAEIQDAQYSLRTCSSELPRTLSPEQLSQGIPRGCSPWFWPSSTRPDKLRRSPAEHPQELAGQRTTQKPRDTYDSQPLVERDHVLPAGASPRISGHLGGGEASRQDVAGDALVGTATFCAAQSAGFVFRNTQLGVPPRVVILLDSLPCCSRPDNLNFPPFVPAYNYLFAIIAY